MTHDPKTDYSAHQYPPCRTRIVMLDPNTTILFLSLLLRHDITYTHIPSTTIRFKVFEFHTSYLIDQARISGTRKMHAAKEKVSNMASTAKEKLAKGTAKGEEAAAMATARTGEERAMAHEHEKAKEAQAKMELHEDKAQHAGHKQDSKLTHHLNPLHTHGTAGGGISQNPAGGYPPGYIP